MQNSKKMRAGFFLIFLVIIPIAALAHYLIFPQQTRCILIDYSNFKKEGRIYFNRTTAHYKIDTLQALVQRATQRVSAFWVEKAATSKFIYCDNDDDFKKYGSTTPVPALTHIKLGSYIVISNQGLDLDIVSHEMSHAALYHRIGFYNWSFKIPRWFDEGLAMQNDYRNYYSEDTLKVRSDNYKNLPRLKSFKSDGQFYEGSNEQVMLNFMTARHEISKWYSREKLEKLIEDLNSGKSFQEAFKE
ncbi:MAG: hypothetical protein ABI416_15970 [Ginsengibacter sp.]